MYTFNICVYLSDILITVMDVDYAPTGKEFVSGSYDKTVRIFPLESGRSRYLP